MSSHSGNFARRLGERFFVAFGGTGGGGLCRVPLLPWRAAGVTGATWATGSVVGSASAGGAGGGAGAGTEGAAGAVGSCIWRGTPVEAVGTAVVGTFDPAVPASRREPAGWFFAPRRRRSDIEKTCARIPEVSVVGSGSVAPLGLVAAASELAPALPVALEVLIRFASTVSSKSSSMGICAATRRPRVEFRSARMASVLVWAELGKPGMFRAGGSSKAGACGGRGAGVPARGAEVAEFAERALAALKVCCGA